MKIVRLPTHTDVRLKDINENKTQNLRIRLGRGWVIPAPTNAKNSGFAGTCVGTGFEFPLVRLGACNSAEWYIGTWL